MTRKYFGTDGIRGTVGQAPITPDFVLRLGHAVGQVLRRTETRPTVLIGKDTRISGYMLESALEAGFASAGVDVLLTGPLPTPGRWRLVGVDAEGMDLVDGDDVRRVWFDTELTSAKDMHMTLVRMAGEARRGLDRPLKDARVAS